MIFPALPGGRWYRRFRARGHKGRNMDGP